jgi:glycosyltransferase involved in cell wall biosynthesis
VVISPVKDEEKYVRNTLDSMVAQTIKPLRWIIVDDGSSDRTPEILKSYALAHGFISLVTCSRGDARQPGAAVVRAFSKGYEVARGLDYEVLVKLDCDLSFESDYFERLLAKMRSDPHLGIASGVYLEAHDGVAWREIEMPPYHAAGASKMIRRACFEQIGGFMPVRGWDTVDEIRAMARGWRTQHFGELRMKHWKPEGMGIGSLRTNFMHGEVYYLTGGSKRFFLLKVLHRLTQRPYLMGGVALTWGYLRTMFSKKASLVTSEESRCYRTLLHRRVHRRIKQVFRSASKPVAS